MSGLEGIPVVHVREEVKAHRKQNDSRHDQDATKRTAQSAVHSYSSVYAAETKHHAAPLGVLTSVNGANRCNSDHPNGSASSLP